MKNENQEELHLVSHCPATSFLPECQQKVETMDSPVFESLPDSFHFMLPPLLVWSASFFPRRGPAELLGCSWEETEDEGEMGAEASRQNSPLPTPKYLLNPSQVDPVCPHLHSRHLPLKTKICQINSGHFYFTVLTQIIFTNDFLSNRSDL